MFVIGRLGRGGFFMPDELSVGNDGLSDENVQDSVCIMV